MWSMDGVLISVATGLFPLYVFPSGAIQPSHIVFMALCAIALFKYGVPRQRWVWLFVALSLYTAVVEIYYGIVYEDFEYSIYPIFFIFNCVLSAGVYHVVLRKGPAVLKVGVLVAAAYAVVTVVTSGVSLYEAEDGWRSTGSFNNPNQLGYFSCCLLSLSYLLYRHGEVRFPVMLGLVAASLYLAMTSLSKAAIIANLVVLAFVLQSQATSLTRRIALLVILLGGSAYLLMNGYLDNFLFFERIVNMASENDSSLDERGYFAFLDGNPWQVVPGLGSSEVRRIVGHEVHSTFASMLNTYGIIGFGFFAAMFVIWGTRLYRAYGLAGLISLQGPSILYGITHNGTRFSIFWLLFASSMALATRELSLRSQAQRARLHPSSGLDPFGPRGGALR
jgi:hypothetical protein